MDQIEVIIKIQIKNLKNYMLIGRSDKIEKLKELCEKISDVPPDKQILIYKGKILSNDKLISDYNINDGDNIILTKKEEPSSVNNSLVSSLSNNKEIDFTEIANILKQNPFYLSFIQKIDLDKLINFCQSIGLGSFSDIFEIEPQKYKQIINKPEYKDIMNNMLNDLHY